MGTLSRWERAIERFERSLFAKAQSSEPVELLDALRRECDDHAVVCSLNRVVVPNVYTVELARDVFEELTQHGESVGQELTDTLARHGESKGYEWAGPLTVRITGATEVPNGRYRLTSRPMSRIEAGALAGNSS
ncbi:DUF3662 domain-containing protein [Streptomyces sp. NPDC057445]|uniref:DUF3662 domain-containing protein n=1 Tax=Streptomyces sp. NPDC057445 TaxID=3346136 RepID=UPI003686B792